MTDSQAAAVSAWRIATTGAPWMDGVETSALEGSPFPEMWLVEGRDGHIVHNRTPGAILPAVPFYLSLNRSSEPADFNIWVGGVAASFWAALSGALLFLALRRVVTDRLAWAGAAAFLLTTPVWSVAANAMWTHNLTLVAIAGALWSASRNRWSLTGAWLALGIVARPHLAVIAAAAGLYVGWRRRDWRLIGRLGVTSASGLVLLALWNRLVFGSWSLKGGYGDYVTGNIVATGTDSVLYSVANVVGFVLAADRGLLVWTPTILILLPSMLATWREIPDWVRGFVLGGLFYSLLQLRMNSFQGGQNFFGYRLALELLICLTPALVLAYRHTARGTRVVIGAILGLQFAAMAVGASTEAYFVRGGDMWFTNAFAVALSDRPLMYGTLTAVCVLSGASLFYVLSRPPVSPEAGATQSPMPR